VLLLAVTVCKSCCCLTCIDCSVLHFTRESYPLDTIELTCRTQVNIYVNTNGEEHIFYALAQ